MVVVVVMVPGGGGGGPVIVGIVLGVVVPAGIPAGATIPPALLKKSCKMQKDYKIDMQREKHEKRSL